VLPGLVFRLMRGTLAGAKGIAAGQHLSAFEVRCDRPLPLQADGEDLGDVIEVRFEAEPDALLVLV
jgi:diacylglycerol kinase family enzyme